MNGGGILGVILAGGAGQRVGGADKGLVTVHGTPVVSLVAKVLAPQCDQFLIVANRNQGDYGRVGRVISDETPGHAGPLAGIVAALAFALNSDEPALRDSRWLLTVPVDCPDFPDDLFARLHDAANTTGADCVYARDHHKLQPLFALYSLKNAKQLLHSARDAARVHASPLRWHLHLGAKAVDFTDRTEAFHNLNALKDFAAYEAARAPVGEGLPSATPAPHAEDDVEPQGMSANGYPTRVDLELGLEIVGSRAAQCGVDVASVSLADAHGRVLADAIPAPIPLPPFANAAMDGFALRGADLPATGTRDFTLIGSVFAGATSAPSIGAGECVRITTGAPMPEGADTVVIKENASVDGETIHIKAGEQRGAHVRAAGEDYAEGDLAFMPGTRLGAVQLAVLAALGIAEVPVRRRPRIAIIATGDELVETGSPLGFGQIHDSNAVMLAAMARDFGMHVSLQTRERDEPMALQQVLLDAATDADIIVTSGGVSAGEADHLPRVLETIGTIHFHKVRVKPGMPILFGQIGASLYFGLPGNPVSAAVTFRVFVRFAVRAMLGVTAAYMPESARLATALHKRHQRAEFVRCRLHTDDAGVQWATPHARQGSGMLSGLAESDALALLPEGEKQYQRGDVVTLWPD